MWTEGDLLPQDFIEVLVKTPDSNLADEVPKLVNLVDVIFESSD